MCLVLLSAPLSQSTVFFVDCTSRGGGLDNLNSSQCGDSSGSRVGYFSLKQLKESVSALS